VHLNQLPEQVGNFDAAARRRTGSLDFEALVDRVTADNEQAEACGIPFDVLGRFLMGATVERAYEHTWLRLETQFDCWGAPYKIL
jgi:hypothetical protein